MQSNSYKNSFIQAQLLDGEGYGVEYGAEEVDLTMLYRVKGGIG